MAIYYVLIGLPMLVSAFSYALRKRFPQTESCKQTAGISIFFVTLIAMLCLRDMACGIDLKNYYSFWRAAVNANSFQKALDAFGIEKGYAFLEYVVALFTDEFQIFLSVVALLCLVPVWLFYRKHAEMSMLAVLLFVNVAPFSMYFSGLRQSLAMAFAIPAYLLARKKKLIWFILVCAVATTLHNSAFVLVLLYPLCNVKLTLKWLYAVVPIMGAILVFSKQIFSFLVPIFGGDYAEGYEIGENTGAYSILILLIIFAVYCFVIPDEEKIDDDTRALRNILLLAVCIQMFAPVHGLVMRVNYYFLPFVPVLIPRIVRRAKESMRQLVLISMIVMYSFFTVYFFYHAYTGADILRIYPYIPFWKG